MPSDSRNRKVSNPDHIGWKFVSGEPILTAHTSCIRVKSSPEPCRNRCRANTQCSVTDRISGWAARPEVLRRACGPLVGSHALRILLRACLGIRFQPREGRKSVAQGASPGNLCTRVVSGSPGGATVRILDIANGLRHGRPFGASIVFPFATSQGLRPGLLTVGPPGLKREFANTLSESTTPTQPEFLAMTMH
jgi:hypothetical protein